MIIKSNNILFEWWKQSVTNKKTNKRKDYTLAQKNCKGAGEGSGPKSTFCSCRAWAQFPAPTRLLTTTWTPVRRANALFFTPWVPGMHMVQKHKCRQNTCTHKINKKFRNKIKSREGHSNTNKQNRPYLHCGQTELCGTVCTMFQRTGLF